ALTPVSSGEIPFPVPRGWQCVRLGEVCEVLRGVTYAKAQASDVPSPDLIALLRAHNIQDRLLFERLVYVPRVIVGAGQMFRVDDVLFGIASGSANLVGKSARVAAAIDATFGAFTAIARPFITSIATFLVTYCNSPTGHDLLIGMGRGIGINNLKTTDLAA